MSAALRGRVLVVGSILAAVALVGAYLAAGGSSYVPAKTQNPCEHRPWANPHGLQEIAQQFSLSALDGAACKLGVTRETLARALVSSKSREEFMQRYHIGDAQLAVAIRAGLLRAVNDAEEAGALSPLLAGPLRETLKKIPLDQAIELVKDARSLLENAQSFLGGAEGLLGPAEGLLKQFLP